MVLLYPSWVKAAKCFSVCLHSTPFPSQYIAWGSSTGCQTGSSCMGARIKLTFVQHAKKVQRCKRFCLASILELFSNLSSQFVIQAFYSAPFYQLFSLPTLYSMYAHFDYSFITKQCYTALHGCNVRKVIVCTQEALPTTYMKLYGICKIRVH